MKINIVPIGTSKGIHLPTAVLKQCQIKKAVELEVLGKTILIKSLKTNPRLGWNEACKAMHMNHDDKLLYHHAIDLDLGDWEW